MYEFLLQEKEPYPFDNNHFFFRKYKSYSKVIELDNSFYCIYCSKKLEGVLVEETNVFMHNGSYLLECECMSAKLEKDKEEITQLLIEKEKNNLNSINELKYKYELKKLKERFNVND